MAKLIRIVFLFGLAQLLWSQGLWATEIPDFSANYLVKLNGLQAGELKRTLKTNTDGTRLFSSETQAKGVFSLFKPDLVIETSVWKKQDNAIRPLKYVYKRSGGKKEKFMQLDFDWPKSTLHIDDKQHPWSLKLKQNSLDKLVYQISLMADLTEEKSTFSYQIADGGKLKTYDIEIKGHEVITTPLGKIDTVKLSRLRDEPKGRETVLWCAPALNYLPVMLEHSEKGGAVFTAVLRQLKGIAIADAFEPLQPSTKTGFTP
ncbi:MAG: DUF3108 domain-containing protein [Gammaproteobacteria bacterium]|nr:DUF3108 domain-containing protein [Gammaproteobacteria bacterium]